MADFSLALFGSPRLSGNGSGSSGPTTFRHRLAVLALLAEAPAYTLSRGRLAGLLWPEVEEPRARHRLNVSVHELRRTLGEATLRSEGDSVCLDTGRLRIDVVEFRAALAEEDLSRAVNLHVAPFLDGFSLPEAPEFERWVESSRESLAAAYRAAVEELAQRGDRGEDPFAALEWHRRLTESDQFNTRYVVRYMLALERAGDAPNALLIARRHEELLEAEFGATTDPVFQAVVARLKRQPTGLDAPYDSGRLPTPLEQSRNEPHQADPAEILGAISGPTPKSSRQPPRWSVFAGAGLLAVVAGAVLLGRPDARPHPERVLVVPPQNRTGDRDLDRLGWAVADWISQGAEGSDLPRVIDPLLAFSTAKDSNELSPVRIREVAERTGATTIVTGTIDLVSDSLRFVLRVTSAQGGQVLATIERRTPVAAGPHAALDDIRDGVLGSLAAQFDRRLDLVRVPASTLPNFQAYRELVLGTEAYLTGKYSDAADRFLAAAIQDTVFTTARVLAGQALLRAARFRAADSMTRALEPFRARLAASDRSGLDWLGATLRGDRLGAYRAAREAAQTAPASRWVVTYADEATGLNQPGEALDALRRVIRNGTWFNEWPDYHRSLGRALHLAGRFEEELRQVRRGRVQAADVIRQAIAETRPLAAMGRAAEINRLIDQILALGNQPNLDPGSLMQRAAEELRAHGYPDEGRRILHRAIAYYAPEASDTTKPAVGLWALGNVLYRAGQIDSAQRAYQELARRGRVVRYRIAGFAGLMAAMQGRTAEAAAWMDSLAAPAPQLNTFDASTRVYYRARIAAQLGEHDRAVSLLQEALAAGLPSNVAMDSVHVEPELYSLRGHPAFDAMVRLNDRRALVAGPTPVRR